MSITLIGLGTEKGDMSMDAKNALDVAEKIMARSEKMCAFSALDGYEVETLDSIFESSRNFDTLNKNLAQKVISEGRNRKTVYCVDGCVSDDEACKVILSKGKDVTVYEGVSKAQKFRTIAGMRSSVVTSCPACDAENLRPCTACVIYDIDDAHAAELTKERLSELFGEEETCSFIKGGKAVKMKIYEIDRQAPYGLDCAVAVDEVDFFKKQRYDYEDLVHIIKLLRAPGGCPWDRAQTNESIKSNMIEEAYELVDAIERDDDDAMIEEAGDVLLQAAFHAVMKEEAGSFSNGDMISELVKKLIFRHSHIFGTDKAGDADEALGVWDKNKAEEKSFETFSDSVKGVSRSFPAAMRAQKIQKRAAKSGMDFLSSVSAAERMTDEVNEMVQAQIDEDKDKIDEEAGDVLFSAVNTCRLAGVDCEEVLAAACDKFTARFERCEKLVLSEGKKMTDLNELELDWYWLRAKDDDKKD
ncbi:MAG: nucleoside triphosphate pyrophosphohydrolase [Clostridia bacterium]|nr:nucleoside triphosphate pyrophosphohydrolase [Clostridia bacterium]